MYLAVILDRFFRKVVGWAVDRTMMSSWLTVAALERAVANRQPQAGLVHHSDRGVQYASPEYVAVLEKHSIVASMSRPANPFDDEYLGWKSFVRGSIEAYEAEGNHDTIYKGATIRKIAERVDARLA